jgi:hypothetical protein
MSDDTKRRRRVATNAQVDDLTRRNNSLRAMVRSLIMFHESPDKMLDPSPEGRAKLVASAKAMLAAEDAR